MKLKPKNWDQHQHYKNRTPPWIKLHRDLLTDRDFMMLPIASKALAPLLWLLASESPDGLFKADVEELSFRLHIDQKTIAKGIKPLIDKGFFLDASNMLATCYQDASAEREGETELERDHKKKNTSDLPKKPPTVNDQTWVDFLKHRNGKKAPVTTTALTRLQNSAEKANMSLEDVMGLMMERGWQGFDPSWVQDSKAKQDHLSAGGI